MAGVPADPATVRTAFQAMADTMANVQTRYAGALTNVEANLARYGPGVHDLEDFGRVDFGAQAAQLRADLGQIATWMQNARSVLASTGSSALQAMRQMLADGSWRLIVQEGAATLEPEAPLLVTGGIAGAGLAQASGMSLMTAIGLGLAGGLLLAGLVGGGYWAYNHFHNTGSSQPVAASTTTTTPPTTTETTDTGTPSATSTTGGDTVGPTETAPPVQQVQPPPPPVLPPQAVPTTTTTAPVDIDGTYSLLAPSCPVDRCWLKVTRQGTDTVVFTLGEHTIPQFPNEGFTVSPLKANVDSSGAFQGSGTATEEDVGGQGHITHQAVSYTISGSFHDANGGPLTTSAATSYDLTLTGDSAATTNGAASFSGQR